MRESSILTGGPTGGGSFVLAVEPVVLVVPLIRMRDATAAGATHHVTSSTNSVHAY